MRKIDISVTKAKITSFNVELKEGLPSVSASINLYTANDKKISSFTLSSEKYYGKNFELPANMIPPITDIAKQLEDILIRECNKELCLLPSEESV